MMMTDGDEDDGDGYFYGMIDDYNDEDNDNDRYGHEK